MCKKWYVVLLWMVFFIGFQTSTGLSQEVGKGQIPAAHLLKSLKILPWGSPIWDVDDAVSQIKAKNKILWIDTRPESFFKKGSVKNAVLFPFNQSGKEGNSLTKEILEAQVLKAGMTKDDAIIVIFCQGPKCHRSYNAAFVAVTKWGFKKGNIVWFRDGYPVLFKMVKNSPKLKRRAKKYINEAGVKQL